jgi:hypothetical protein
MSNGKGNFSTLPTILKLAYGTFLLFIHGMVNIILPILKISRKEKVGMLNKKLKNINYEKSYFSTNVGSNRV